MERSIRSVLLCLLMTTEPCLAVQKFQPVHINLTMGHEDLPRMQNSGQAKHARYGLIISNDKDITKSINQTTDMMESEGITAATQPAVSTVHRRIDRSVSVSDLRTAKAQPLDHRSHWTGTGNQESVTDWNGSSGATTLKPKLKPDFIYSHSTLLRQNSDTLAWVSSDQQPNTQLVRPSPHMSTPLLMSHSLSAVKWPAMEDWSHRHFEVDVSTLCQSEADVGDSGLSVFPHPTNCAWYVNCSISPDAIMVTYFEGYVMECPYPQLFSPSTRQCQDFKQVKCQDRFEPKSPCEYRANTCRESSHCIPCWVRYASCQGLADGLNSWRGLEWHRFFVECHQERTVFQGVCHSSAVFSPVTRACETPMSIPSQYGGWKPGCAGRRDGLYPDHLGRCDLYFLCQAQLFRGFHSCGGNTKFHPYTAECRSPDQVPFPCGDRPQPHNLCHSRSDGNFQDIFGRCNHFFTCNNRTMVGIFVCSEGMFNVRTGQCDTRPSGQSDLPSPCGEMTNVCLSKPDGVYLSQTDTVKLSCQTEVTCARGLVIRTTINCR